MYSYLLCTYMGTCICMRMCMCPYCTWFVYVVHLCMYLYVSTEVRVCTTRFQPRDVDVCTCSCLRLRVFLFPDCSTICLQAGLEVESLGWMA